MVPTSCRAGAASAARQAGETCEKQTISHSAHRAQTGHTLTSPTPCVHLSTCLQTLGTGAFGSVRLVHDRETKKLLALKSLKRRNINKYLESEIVNHSLLRWVVWRGKAQGRPWVESVRMHKCLML